MKSIWNGTISFGLVNIPIKMYSAIESHEIGFKMLHKTTHTPIKYKRWCPECNREVPLNEIVKGIEIESGKYFELSKELLDSIKPEKADSIEIVKFIDLGQLNPVYFNKHYYLGPEKENERAYFLFKEVLQSSSKVAIGRFVMREKEYICIIESYKEGLLLTTLNYADEIRDIGEIDQLKERPKLKKQELDLANELINKLYEKDFEITQFKDTFAEKLKQVLVERKRGKVVLIGREKSAQKEKTLMEALKASLK